MGIFAKWRATKKKTGAARKVSAFRRTSRWIVLPFLGVLLVITGLKLWWPTSSAEASWFDQSWLYRTAHILTNSGVAITEERKIKIEVDTAALITAGKMQSDCDDVRFTDNSGNVLEYFIDTATDDCNTSSTDFYVKVPSVIAGDQTLFLYYGNPSAARGRANDFFGQDATAEGLISYYPLDEITANTCTGGSSDSCDYASTSDGTWNGNAGYTATAKIGGAVTLDGTGDYINVPDTTALNSYPLSVSVWFKTTATNTTALVSKYYSASLNGWQLFMESGNICAWYFANASNHTYDGTGCTLSTSGFNDGNWHHAVFVVDSSGGTLYIDGSEEATQAWTGTPAAATSTQPVTIGYYEPNSYLAGQLDDVRIYQTALSEPEITSIYNAGNPQPIPVPRTHVPSNLESESEERSPGPIASWSFDEGYGSTAYDGVGTNHGTLTGGPTWQTEDQCISGKCLYFDGSDDYITASDPNINGYATISMWIKGTSGAIFDTNPSTTGALRLILNSDQTMRYESGGSTLVTSTAIGSAQNQWHHISLVVSNGTHTLYSDGKVIGTDTGNNSATSTTFEIGRYNSTAYFHGFIDEVKIYPYARTAAQIKADYNARGGNSGTTAQVGSANLGQSLSDGLVAYYPMDETAANTCPGGTNDTCDASGNGLDGTWNGDATDSAGRFGSGVDLDGTGDYVAVTDADPLDITGDWTIAGWFNDTDANLNHSIAYLVTKGSVYGQSDVPYYLALGNNILRAGIVAGWTDQNVQVDVSSSLSVNEWNHFVATFTEESNTLQLYINGELQETSSSITNTPAVNTSELAIGRRPSGDSYFTGAADEVRIYNRSLSEAEVGALYNWAPGPVAHWKLDDNSGSSAVDYSGHNLTGTLINSPTWASGKYGSALQFDGSTNYLRTPNTPANDTITVTAWVKANTRAQWGTIAKNWPNDSSIYKFHFGLQENDGDLSVYIAEADDNAVGPVRETTQFPLGSWQFVAFTADGSNIRLFRNGKQVGSTTPYDGTLNPGGAYTGIGAKLSNAGIPDIVPGHWDGLIDDVQIYNYALTQDQLTNVMNGRDVNTPAVGSPVGHPVLHMSFDEGYGTTAFDKSQYGNNGTLTNMASPATATSGWTNSGKFGKALAFDGSNDYVSVAGSYPGTTTSRTMCAWVKSADTTIQGNADHVVNYGAATTNQAFGIMSYTGNTWWFYGHGAADINTGIAVDTNWHNHCVSYDGSTVRYYYDAQLVATAARTLATGTNNFKVGTSPDGATGNSFNGVIDEVLLFNYALTENEIKLQYNNQKSATFGSTGTESDGATASNAGGRAYCPPSDTATCNAPIAEYTLDENTGTSAFDTSGNNNTGTLTNGPTWTPGKFGSSVKLDGINDYLLLGTNSVFNPSDALTISGWIYPTSLASRYYIMGKMGGNSNRGYQFYVETDGSLAGVSYAGDTIRLTSTSAGDITPNKWYYVTYTRINGSQALYINGQQKATTTHAGPFSNSTNPAALGTGWDTNGAGGFHSSGSLDQVRLYDYVRTPAQIAWEYNKGAPIAHYKFDECQGTTAYNSAPTASGEAAGNDGTITIGASGTNTSAGTCEGSAGEAWADGATGQLSSSLEFDGVDDYVTTPNMTNVGTTGDFSVQAWFKTSTAGKPIVHYQYGAHTYGRWTVRSDLVSVYGGASSPSYKQIAINGYEDGNWHNIAAVYSRTDSKIYAYIDGRLYGSTTWDGYIELPGTSPYIGYQSNPARYFSGQIDDVRIYNYALTDDQVREVYNNGAVSFR